MKGNGSSYTPELEIELLHNCSESTRDNSFILHLILMCHVIKESESIL